MSTPSISRRITSSGVFAALHSALAACPCRGFRPPHQRRKQRIGFDRLAHVVIHPCFQAALPLFHQRMGGHCDNRKLL